MIKLLRKARSESLKNVADSLKISESFLSQIENGNRKPSPDLIQNLSKYYDVDIDIICVSLGVIPAWLLTKLKEYPIELIEAATDDFRKYGK